MRRETSSKAEIGSASTYTVPEQESYGSDRNECV